MVFKIKNNLVNQIYFVTGRTSLPCPISIETVVIFDAVGLVSMDAIRVSFANIVLSIILVMTVLIILIANWSISAVDILREITPGVPRIVQELPLVFYRKSEKY